MPTPSRPPERIQAGDLLLRRWSYDDVDAMLAAVAASHDHLRAWMAWAQNPPTREAQLGFARASLQEWQEATTFAYGVFDRAGELVGSVGLHARIGAGGLEVGYWVRADRQGQGIVTRATEAVTDAAFALPEIDRVEIHCDEANVRSAAVPRRLGFRLVEVREGSPQAPNDVGRDQVWRVTREQWLRCGGPEE